ncbi:hypothetical protein VOLCADRAFT_107200 [Volvox carteri f. nagariensis]|uniref:Sfi1 spindle body domain-containing protein n=1 Tax=Volvox carteri f. nagariensis TaxID=3068 RepID=D8UCJ6_VOLCA|nr:uncharacterized protein VOLCADRAFT_107200 [Volvox carteri f. nagariensis]EFJ42563.1 hypothetical protein VOLCADRAFT_107200 [Volvox carteri f. nagariensis]|eukprot:XP_002956419.1 hypothetical protein VOLCADRAFT_107200 [Volvox carteri f. nagariensis]
MNLEGPAPAMSFAAALPGATSSASPRPAAAHDSGAPTQPCGSSQMVSSEANDPDTDTAGDDQPSRWQLLVKRMNAEVPTTGLSPAAAKPTHSPNATPSDQASSPIGQRGAGAVQYGSPALRQKHASPRAPTEQAGSRIEPKRDQYDRTETRHSPLRSCSTDADTGYAHAHVPGSAVRRLAAPSRPSTVSAAARYNSANRRYQPASGHLDADVTTATSASPYERAVAALQQAEQQLRVHKQYRGGGGGGDGATHAVVPAVASPASGALAAAERFLATGQLCNAPVVVHRATAMYGNTHVASRLGVDQVCDHDSNPGSFEEVARGLVNRLTSSVRLGLGLPGATAAAATGPLVHSYALLEPPPAQHVAAAAALAAAAAAGKAESSGRAAAAAAVTAAPELELQVAMQGLMAAARQASSEEAQQAEQQRKRREAAEAAEAAIAAVEERAAQLARVVLYLRLWRTAARWSRRETDELAAGLNTSRLRRYFAAWRTAARAARAERLAAEALELAAEARWEQVAHRFRRLWLLHYSLVAWRRAATAGLEARRRQAVVAGELSRERQAAALRKATADRFRRLWLLHSHMRVWRTAARAQATARLVAGGGGSATAAAATASGGQVVQQHLAPHTTQQRRSAAVAALLNRLRSQREAFRGPVAAAAGAGASCAAASAAGLGSDGYGGASSGGDDNGGHAVQPAAAAAAPTASRPFPGLNHWIRPEVMRGRRGAGGGAASKGSVAAAAAPPQPPLPPGCSGSRVTVPLPFQLSTSVRARCRRDQVLAACAGTRHLVKGVAVPPAAANDPWVTTVAAAAPHGPTMAPAAVAPVWAAECGAVGRRGRSCGGGGCDSQGTDTALETLRQVVRQRHQQRVMVVEAAAAAGAGPCGGVPPAVGASVLLTEGGQRAVGAWQLEPGPGGGGPRRDAAPRNTVRGQAVATTASAAAAVGFGGLLETFPSSASSEWSDREEGAGALGGSQRQQQEGEGGVGEQEEEEDMRPLAVAAVGDPGVDQQHVREEEEPAAPGSADSEAVSEDDRGRQQLPRGGRPTSNTAVALAVGGVGPSLAGGLTAVDLERLRAAEIRKRRAADDRARRVASELVAHMTQLAVVHCRRGTLKWYGLQPWIQLAALARRAALTALRHFSAGLLRRALLRGPRPWVLVNSIFKLWLAARPEPDWGSSAESPPPWRWAAVVTGSERGCGCGWWDVRCAVCSEERVARAVLGRLIAWVRAASLHRRHVHQRVLLGLMRAARASWAAQADAVEHCWRRRVWSCLQGWRVAAERQASERLLWELQRQHELEVALGRRTARRVLAEWRRLQLEAAEQRTALQHRSQKWAKVQGWLAEVQMARSVGNRAGSASSSGSGAATGGVPTERASYSSQAAACGGASETVAEKGTAAVPADNVADLLNGDVVSGGSDARARDPRGGRGGPISSGGHGGGGGRDVCCNEDDPLGLGPLEEQLQQFSLGPSYLGLQEPPSGGRNDPWVTGGGGGSGSRRRQAWHSKGAAAAGRHCDSGDATASAAVATTASVAPLPPMGPAAPLPGLESNCERAKSHKWAAARRKPAADPLAAPPVLANRQQRLARYLSGRSAGGAGTQPVANVQWGNGRPSVMWVSQVCAHIL